MLPVLQEEFKKKLLLLNLILVSMKFENIFKNTKFDVFICALILSSLYQLIL